MLYFPFASLTHGFPRSASGNRPEEKKQNMCRFRSSITVTAVILLSLLLFHGCSNRELPDSGIGSVLDLEGTSGNAQVAFKVLLPDSGKRSQGKSAVIRADLSDRPRVTFRLIVLRPGNVGDTLLTLSRTVLADEGGTAQAGFSDVPCRPVIGEILIEGGNIGGYSQFQGGGVLEIGDNLLDLAPVGSNLAPDLKAGILMAVAAFPGLLEVIDKFSGSKLEAALAEVSPLAGNPQEQVLGAFLRQLGTAVPGARLVLDADPAFLGCTGGTGTWRKSAGDLFTSGALGDSDPAAFRPDRIFLPGADGRGLAGWKNTGETLYVIASHALDTGTVAARLLHYGRVSCLCIMPGGILVGGFSSLHNCPVLFKWPGTADGNTPGPKKAAAGLSWTIPFDAFPASGANIPNVEFLRVLGPDRAVCGIRNPASGSLSLFSIDPQVGTYKALISSVSLSLAVVTGSGAADLNWDTVGGALGYTVMWATSSAMTSSGSFSLQVASPPCRLAGLKNGIPHFFRVRAEGLTPPVVSPIVKAIPMPPNFPPKGELMGPTEVLSGATFSVSVFASDPDGDFVSVTWGQTSGTRLSESATQAFFLAPMDAASVTVTCRLSDPYGVETQLQKNIAVASWVEAGTSPILKAVVASGGEVTDPTTGLVFHFPDGASCTIEVTRLSEYPDPGIDAGEGFLVRTDCSAPMAIRMPSVSEAGENRLMVYGPPFNHNNCDIGWNPIPPFRKDPAGQLVELPIPSPSVVARVRARLGRTMARGKGDGLSNRELNILRKGVAQAALEERQLRQRVHAAINAVLAELPGDLRAIASSTIADIGGLPEVYLDVVNGETRGSSYVAFGGHGLFGYTFFYTTSGFFSFSRGRDDQPPSTEVPARTVIHEVGHCLNHLLTGNNFIPIMNAALEDHGLGIEFPPRKTITDEYAYYFEYLMTGLIGDRTQTDPRVIRPNIENGKAHPSNFTTRSSPRKMDYPSVEGFGCGLMASIQHGGPVGMDAFGSATPLLGPLEEREQRYYVFSSGASTIDQLLTWYLGRFGRTAPDETLAMLMERMGWSYEVTGKVSGQGGELLPGFNVRPFIVATGTVLADFPFVPTNAFGSFLIPRCFPGSFTLEIMTETALGKSVATFPGLIDSRLPTNEKATLLPLIWPGPGIGAVTPSDLPYCARFTISGSGFSPDSCQVFFQSPSGDLAGVAVQSVSANSIECVRAGNDNITATSGWIFVKNSQTSGGLFSNRFPVTIEPGIRSVGGSATPWPPQQETTTFRFIPGGPGYVGGDFMTEATGTISAGTLRTWSRTGIELVFPAGGGGMTLSVTSALGATSDSWKGEAVNMGSFMGKVDTISGTGIPDSLTIETISGDASGLKIVGTGTVGPSLDKVEITLSCTGLGPDPFHSSAEMTVIKHHTPQNSTESKTYSFTVSRIDNADYGGGNIRSFVVFKDSAGAEMTIFANGSIYSFYP